MRYFMTTVFSQGFRGRPWVGLPNAALAADVFLKAVLSVSQYKYRKSIALPLQAAAPHGATV